MFDGAPRPPSRGTTFGSATWHGYLEFIGSILPAIRRGEVDESYAARVAREMQDSATWRVGRMPLMVQAFIQQYGADTSASADNTQLDDGNPVSRDAVEAESAARRGR